MPEAHATTRPPETTPARPGIDEIPTHPSAFKAVVVSVASVMLGLMLIGLWYYGMSALDVFLKSNALVEIHFEKEGEHGFDYLGLSQIAFGKLGLLGAGCVFLGIISLLRLKVTYLLLRSGLLLLYPYTVIYLALAWLAVFSLKRSQTPVNGGELSHTEALGWWWSLSWPALLLCLYTFWLHVMLWSRPVYAAFTRQGGQAMAGDRLLEDWRTHGRDPRARKSFYGSFATHVVILILIPLILQPRGCVEAYRVPEGKGEPAVVQVQVVQKKKKKKTLTLRPNSAILFDIPDLDDTEVDRQMEELTQARYEARVNARAGQLGKGGGKQGGWPEGMEDYRIRFIRLDHGGAGWDDGMNQTDADINFLRFFAQATGFKKIANKGESHSIALLDKYPEDGFPPFVYLTGNGGMGRTNSNDWKILREYCLNGGMLIADAGSRNFHNSFLDFIRRVFPDKQLLDIADDEMLYQLPYGFPNGAPAFWGHGGRRAMGIKHEGRWVVFYHPGDMNDAWKSPGYSDVTPEMRDAAMNLGVNLVYYSFNQWNDAVARKRK